MLSKIMEKESNLWNLVNQYPYNPHIWTELVNVAERSHNYEGIFAAYNGFLKQFPLLHIYWSKLATIQRSKTQSAREAVPIFLEALKEGNLYYSVEMWYSYCEFIKTYSAEFTELDIRDAFEKAVSAVGMDYTSDTIWSLYLNWEQERGNVSRVSALFPRILSMPIRNIDKFWMLFMQHIESHPIDDCVTPEELAQIEREISDETDLVTTESINKARSEKILQIRTDKYNQTVQNISSVLLYEMKIHRIYFHFQVPSDEEIANWMMYLQYIESLNDVERTKHLFERCLIPCNFSPEIWMRYIDYIQSNEGVENAVHVAQRAEQTALQIDPSFLKKCGTFYELIGDLENAKRIYFNLSQIKTAESAIAVALYKRRTEQPYLEELTQKYEQENNPRESACLAAFLFKIGELNDLTKLLTLSSTEILALSVLISCYEANNQIDDAVTAYKAFLDGIAPCEDKIVANTAFLSFLFKHKLPLQEIRQAQRQAILFEKQARQELRSRRREIVKKGADYNQVLEQWMAFFKESEALQEQTSTD